MDRRNVIIVDGGNEQAMMKAREEETEAGAKETKSREARARADVGGDNATVEAGG
jgi:hypothetical protein